MIRLTPMPALPEPTSNEEGRHKDENPNPLRTTKIRNTNVKGGWTSPGTRDNFSKNGELKW